MQDLSADRIDLCYSEFRKHCIQAHGLEESDMEARMHLDWQYWTLTLIKA